MRGGIKLLFKCMERRNSGEDASRGGCFSFVIFLDCESICCILKRARLVALKSVKAKQHREFLRVCVDSVL